MEFGVKFSTFFKNLRLVSRNIPIFAAAFEATLAQLVEQRIRNA